MDSDSSGTVRAIGRPQPITVTVEGEIRRPGSYTLSHDATLSTLVVAAGGYTDNADLPAATLTRESGETVTAPSPPTAAEGSPADLPLADGDTLRIPTRTPGAPARARARPTGDEPFTRPNNFGVTGLLETPNARVMPENRYRLGITQVHPYRYYFGTVGLFDRIEVNGRVTQVIGVQGFNNNNSYGISRTRPWTQSSCSSKRGRTCRRSPSSSPTRPEPDSTPPRRSSRASGSSP